MTEDAQGFYEGANSALQGRLDRCFALLKAEPRRHPNIKPLKGPLAGLYRFRVGDYRVVYRVDDRQRVVVIVIIAHRSAVYE